MHIHISSLNSLVYCVLETRCMIKREGCAHAAWHVE